MAVAPMLLQLILTIATFVLATRNRALIREHTAVLLGMAQHVGLAGEGLGASSASPARATVGSGHGAWSGWREGVAHGRCGVGRWNSKGGAVCGMVVATVGYVKGGRGASVRWVGTAISVASRVGAVTVLEIMVVYRRKSGRREGAAYCRRGGRGRGTKGGTRCGIAVAALVHPNGGSGGVVRRVEIGVGITIRVDAITVMEIMAAYGACSGTRESAAHDRRAASELSTKGGGLGAIAAATTMGHPTGGTIVR